MGWLTTLIVFVVILLILAALYVLAFFALNSFVVVDNKIVRAVHIGRKYTKLRLLTFDFRIIYRSRSQVFKDKDRANNLIEVEDENE